MRATYRAHRRAPEVGSRRRLLRATARAVAGLPWAALAAGCLGTGAPPPSRLRGSVRVLVPLIERVPGGDLGALALERTSGAIEEATGGALQVKVERARLRRPATGAPGPPALTQIGELLAGTAVSGTAPDLLYVQPASGAPLTPVWDAQTMAAHRLLAPLEPHVRREGRQLRLPDFLPGALDALRWRGTLHGVPTSARPLLLAYDPSLFAAAAESPPETPPDGVTWDRVRASAARLVQDTRGSGSPNQYGLLAAPQGIVLAQLLLARGVALWNAAGTAPQLHTPAAMEALRFWKALREPDRGTVPLPGAILGVRWEPDRIVAGPVRVAMGFTWSPPVGRDATTAGGAALRLVESPRATAQATLLYVDGFLAVPAAAPDPRRSVQALAPLLDSLLPALPWAARDATPQALAIDLSIASVEEARRILDARRQGHVTPLHLPSPTTVLQAELAEPVERGQRAPQEALAAAIAALTRELNALNAVAANAARAR